MIIRALACDYDGTVATRGLVEAGTVKALGRVRASGRRLVLVTGRLLPDLGRAFPQGRELFDAIVAENGAVLHLPARDETRVLGEPPERGLIDALRSRRIPIELGSSLIATVADVADVALSAIREAGVERSLIFNRDSLMLLPAGVNKGTGLTHALDVLELSAHNVAGIGDAENDHAFLGVCECGVAVKDAVPALRERADLVTEAPGPAGVVELIDRHLLEDLRRVLPGLSRHDLALGETKGGERVGLAAHGTRLLVVAPAGATVARVIRTLIDQLIARGRTFCLVDQGANELTLEDRPGLTILGGRQGQPLPGIDALAQIVGHPRASVVLRLNKMRRPDQVDHLRATRAAVARTSRATSLPHWLIVVDPGDEVTSGPLRDLANGESLAMALVGSPADEIYSNPPSAVVGIDGHSLEVALDTLGIEAGPGPGSPAPELPEGDVLLARLDQGPGPPRRLRLRLAASARRS